VGFGCFLLVDFVGWGEVRTPTFIQCAFFIGVCKLTQPTSLLIVLLTQTFNIFEAVGYSLNQNRR